MHWMTVEARPTHEEVADALLPPSIYIMVLGSSPRLAATDRGEKGKSAAAWTDRARAVGD